MCILLSPAICFYYVGIVPCVSHYLLLTTITFVHGVHMYAWWCCLEDHIFTRCSYACLVMLPQGRGLLLAVVYLSLVPNEFCVIMFVFKFRQWVPQPWLMTLVRTWSTEAGLPAGAACLLQMIIVLQGHLTSSRQRATVGSVFRGHNIIIEILTCSWCSSSSETCLRYSLPRPFYIVCILQRGWLTCTSGDV